MNIFRKPEAQVTVVIPTYNARDSVMKLVLSVLQRSTDPSVVVCDDASTDGTSSVLSTVFGSQITLMRGKHNLGPAGNRNRVLKNRTRPILLFIDADCELIYEKSLDHLVGNAFIPETVASVGFEVHTRSGDPMPWNFGMFMNPIKDAHDQLLETLWQDGKISYEMFTKNAPNRAASVRVANTRRKFSIDWVSEACFAIREDVFRSLGGFDGSMRYHEAHDLHTRIRNKGFTTVFQSTPVVRHLENNSRIWRRREDFEQGRFHYFHKHYGMNKKTYALIYGQ